MKSTLDRERAFFFYLALAMVLVNTAGFSMSIAFGRSSFAVPLIYHLHAVVFFGWMLLYLFQNALVATGNVALHRRLGLLALAWIPAMVVLGIGLTLTSIRTHGGPPFFDVNEFLVGNSLGIVAFAALAFTGIAMRRNTPWHRRIMCCAMAAITGPGLGRLLPMPFLIPWGWWIASVGVPLIFPIIGMIGDKRRSGRVHPAWLWCMGAMVASQLLADAIAYSPAGYALTSLVIKGTPGADRDLRAHFP